MSHGMCPGGALAGRGPGGICALAPSDLTCAAPRASRSVSGDCREKTQKRGAHDYVVLLTIPDTFFTHVAAYV